MIVNPGYLLSLSNGQLLLTKEDEQVEIPIAQIKRLFISSGEGSITIPVLVELTAHNVSVILCDRFRNPIGEFASIADNNESAGRQMDQANWSSRRKSAVWKRIVIMKICSQEELLVINRKAAPKVFAGYIRNVRSNDETNREAVVAKEYFSLLFGSKFVRFADDEINSALDYGYAIIRNSFSRAVAMYGYNNTLGIHHCSRHNRFNLACDLMEPFRPFIDSYVYGHSERKLDTEYKKELISILNGDCLYGRKRMSIDNAIICFTLDALKSMNGQKMFIKELRFVKTCTGTDGIL